MFCKNCGEQINDGGKFCTKCGTPVVPQQQTPPQTPQYTSPQPQYQQTAQTNMNAWEYFVSAVKKYVVFKGRARRAEYWWFVLFNALITWGALLIGNYVLGIGNGLYVLVMLALVLPGLGVAIRRMHDVGKSGWYYLIPIYNIVLLATEGNAGPNQYGPDPKSV
jgi:uncharacterized membrane protein YhaH (DUF805 family)